jgi:DNA-binding transcriptional LysR family regulator
VSVRIDELGYFLAVAEEGNVRRAAERLGISQPALSKAIQKFEASLGFALFERTAKGMQLTRVGENFLTRTSVPHRQLNDAIEDAKDLHLGTLGLLRVGVSPIYLGSLFAPAFVELRRHRPASTVRLLTEFNNKLLQLLSQQQLDVAICGAKPDLPLNGFKRYGLLTDDIVIVVGEKHPLAHIARPSVADLAKFQWVLTRPEEAGRRLIEAEFFNAGLAPPTVALQLNTVTELLYSAVRDTRPGGTGHEVHDGRTQGMRNGHPALQFPLDEVRLGQRVCFRLSTQRSIGGILLSPVAEDGTTDLVIRRRRA